MINRMTCLRCIHEIYKHDEFYLIFCTENIAHLAETALRFLELVQENNLSSEQDVNGGDTEETLHPNENYDSGKFWFYNYNSLLW